MTLHLTQSAQDAVLRGNLCQEKNHNRIEKINAMVHRERFRQTRAEA
jgi:hypothetical protein